MREVDDRPGRRCCAETLDNDDVDCRQTGCGVDDEICAAGAGSTRHGELDSTGNGLVELMECSGGLVTDHRVLTEYQQAAPELETMGVWNTGDCMRARSHTLEPATSKELAALPVSRRMSAQLGVSDQPVLVPRKCSNLLIHIPQWD